MFLRLPTRADRAFFPIVCRTWCSVARQCRLPSPSPVPWLVLPGGNAISFPHGETFQLPEGVRYHNSCGEWLLLSRDDGSCFLMNPFTKATMPLPSLSSYSYYEEPVEVSEDCMVPDDEMPGMWMYNKDTSDVSVLALVECSTRLIAAIVAVGALGTIALCRPGAAAWSVSAHEECRWLSHMVFFQGKLYALDSNTDPEDLIAIDIVDDHDCHEPRVSRIERLIEGASLPPQKYSLCQRYLLESHGTLLMIHRKLYYKTEQPSERRHGGVFVAGSSEFEVFEADFEEGLWSEVRTLVNDQALFLGRGCSRAICVSPYDLSRDCVFFLDDYTNWLWKKTTTSCGVYDMKDEEVYSSLPMVSWKSGDVPATWLFSQGETYKLQAAGEHLQEIVEPEQDDPQTLHNGGTCAAGASTAQRNC
ncbi:hypothetical protein C2845_PM17G00230 [Panicum miliaceum]|uniref:KIB1-4 beta-propeller domain-containing protein n=1 Tax=Panicum miliaceum TaxID=4540 RepID=A0A3L6PZ01_PANMI|nr:hypothetical protein C2845_PM17G00230 [Panicum miliaceum]